MEMQQQLLQWQRQLTQFSSFFEAGVANEVRRRENRVRLLPLSCVKWQFSFEKIEQTNKKQSQSGKEEGRRQAGGVRW